MHLAAATQSNPDAALQPMVQLSGGDPGSILGMLQMVSRVQYRVDDQIKFHVFYLDHRMQQLARDKSVTSA